MSATWPFFRRHRPPRKSISSSETLATYRVAFEGHKVFKSTFMVSNFYLGGDRKSWRLDKTFFSSDIKSSFYGQISGRLFYYFIQYLLFLLFPFFCQTLNFETCDLTFPGLVASDDSEERLERPSELRSRAEASPNFGKPKLSCARTGSLFQARAVGSRPESGRA